MAGRKLRLLLITGSLWASGNPEYEVSEILLVDDFEDGNNVSLMDGIGSTMTDDVASGGSVCTARYDEAPGYDNSRYCALLK